MKSCSAFSVIVENIKSLLLLYNAGDIHQALCEIIAEVPDLSNPPSAPQLLFHLPDVGPVTAKRKKMTPEQNSRFF